MIIISQHREECEVLVELKFSLKFTVDVYFNKDNIDELLIFKENECILKDRSKKTLSTVETL